MDKFISNCQLVLYTHHLWLHTEGLEDQRTRKVAVVVSKCKIQINYGIYYVFLGITMYISKKVIRKALPINQEQNVIVNPNRTLGQSLRFLVFSG
jgi:hypothetical protein